MMILYLIFIFICVKKNTIIPIIFGRWPITTWTEQVRKRRLGFFIYYRGKLEIKSWREEVDCASDMGFCFYSADMIPWGEAIGVYWLVNQMHFSVLYGLVRHGGGDMKLPFFFYLNFQRDACVTEELIETVQHARVFLA